MSQVRPRSEPPRIQPPYYDEDGITIYHADCRRILPGLDDEDVGAIITDPPYGIGKPYGDDYDDRQDGYWEWFLPVVALMRQTAPTVAFTHRPAALKKIHDWDWVYVWNKPNAMSGLNWYPVMPHWEPILTFGIGGRPDLPRGFDVLTYASVPSGGFDHPTPKPVPLFAEMIRRFAPTGAIVDPFMGSGTTLRAAKDLGRRAIGIEIEERYCEIAVQRLAQGVLAL